MSAQDPQPLDIDVLELPVGATAGDWYHAVAALIEMEAFWALHPEWVAKKN